MEGDRIVIIGSGNVATHLARAFDRAGYRVQVYSRNPQHASRLTSTLTNGTCADKPEDIWRDAPFYIISVSDDAIPAVAEMLRDVRGVVAHTSGSVPISALQGIARTAVVYPLQTFSRETGIDMAEVPFFTEASDTSTLSEVDALVSSVSGNVRHAGSSDRAVLHIAAVFACNFTNHLWAIASDLLADKGYPFEVLRPLLIQTLEKALSTTPHEGQTGPARRGDTGVTGRHASMLKDTNKEIYTLLTKSITERYRQNEQN